MRALHHILVTCFLTLGVFLAIGYTACNRDKCKDTSCINGSCYNGICTCNGGYAGDRCEINLCKDVTCENGGMCVEGTCKCPAGYEGAHCEKLNKFIGEYAAYDSCNTSGTNPVYAVAIAMKGNGENVLKIVNFTNHQSVVYGHVTSSGTFTFSGASYEGYYIEGGGEYEEGTGNVHAAYSIVYPSSTVICSGTWVRETPQ